MQSIADLLVPLTPCRHRYSLKRTEEQVLGLSVLASVNAEAKSSRLRGKIRNLVERGERGKGRDS